MSDKFEKVNLNKNTSFKKVQTAKDKNIYVEKVPCPECGSIHTFATHQGNILVGYGVGWFMACLILTACSFLIPIAGLLLLQPLGIGMLISLSVALIGLILSSSTKDLRFECKDCKAVHKIEASEYEEMAKNYILQNK